MCEHNVDNSNTLFPEVWDLGVKQQKWQLRSFRGTGNGAIRWVTYDFPLVFYCNYVSIVHRFCNIITCFPNFKIAKWP